MQMIANPRALDYKADRVNAYAPDARRRIALWFALCFFLRAGVGVWLALDKPGEFVGVDGAEYLDTAHNIASGNGYVISHPRIWDWEFYQPKSNFPANAYPKPEIFR